MPPKKQKPTYTMTVCVDVRDLATVLRYLITRGTYPTTRSGLTASAVQFAADLVNQIGSLKGTKFTDVAEATKYMQQHGLVGDSKRSRRETQSLLMMEGLTDKDEARLRTTIELGTPEDVNTIVKEIRREERASKH